MTVETFLDGRVTLHCGDSRAVIKSMPDCSIDSIVTDPPYALVSIVKRFGKPGSASAKVPATGTGAYARASAGFMGKQWDTGETAFAVEFWMECLRVLKPGGHLVAFSGTRTVHRMVCAIEDAGFEIRDSLFYHYGSGFPKSHDISKRLDGNEKRCSCNADMRSLSANMDAGDKGSTAKPILRANLQGDTDLSIENGNPVSIQSLRDGSLHGVREAESDSSSVVEEGQKTQVLLPMQRRGARTGLGPARAQGSQGAVAGELHFSGGEDDRSGEPGVEGRSDISPASGKLRQREIRQVSSGLDSDGAGGRLRDGASLGDGSLDRSSANSARVCSSPGPYAAEQPALESGDVAGQPESQIGGAWENCRRCGKPVVPDGLGTALKPATEPICLARKPIIGTVADNVLKHGTGAINVDGCRVDGAPDPASWSAQRTAVDTSDGRLGQKAANIAAMNAGKIKPPSGRWPANVIHDGSEEVLEAFPQSEGQQDDVRDNEPSSKTNAIYGRFDDRPAAAARADTGSAARFFYTAKADADDRIGSKHPTVKPVDLMQWLVRLVTPKGGVVLDCFAGTGTTGEAAFREGMRCILIEREEEYQDDIRRRMRLCMAGPDERRRESIKAKGEDKPFEEGTLFAELEQ